MNVANEKAISTRLNICSGCKITLIEVFCPDSSEIMIRAVWPGDTIGISLLPTHGHAPQKVQLSWGSAVSGPSSQIFAATVTP